MGGPAGENEVQTHLWQVLAEDDAVGLGQLVDYYMSLEGKAARTSRLRLPRIAPGWPASRPCPL